MSATISQKVIGVRTLGQANEYCILYLENETVEIPYVNLKFKPNDSLPHVVAEVKTEKKTINEGFSEEEIIEIIIHHATLQGPSGKLQVIMESLKIMNVML